MQESKFHKVLIGYLVWQKRKNLVFIWNEVFFFSFFFFVQLLERSGLSSSERSRQSIGVNVADVEQSSQTLRQKRQLHLNLSTSSHLKMFDFQFNPLVWWQSNNENMLQRYLLQTEKCKKALATQLGSK